MERNNKNTIASAISFLPARLAEAVSAADTRSVEELRLRVGRPVQLVSAYGDSLIEGAVFTRDEARELLERLCRRSVYSRADELSRGYLTVEGGARIGVCGRPVTENGRIVSLTDVTCFNIRITREAKGCAEGVMPYLTERGRPVSAIVAAPPGGGKTTLLRDIARCFSEGIGCRACKVALVDERSELAGCVDGAPGFDLGPRTDVMECADKAVAMGIMVRSMSPDVIITDEIGGKEDAEAVSEASRCGSAVIASAHAATVDDLKNRPSTARILETGVFKRILLIRRTGDLLHISPVKL